MTNQAEVQLGAATPLFSAGKWTVQDMVLSVEKIKDMWLRLSKQHKTLFSDLTRDNFDSWFGFVTNPDNYWMEVCDENGVLGVIYFEGMHRVVDVQMHMLFYDRMPAEKLPVVKASIAFMFKNFPLKRISVEVPRIYHATIRLTERVGFKREGVKREAVLIGGRWIDIFMFGILRKEVTWDF